MNKKIAHIGLDVDDTQYHGAALNKATGELFHFKCRPTLKGFMSQLSVSAVIIGMGSSLPELSVSLVALWRGRGGLSVGNLMGSNVLDTLLVPGIGAAVSPLAVQAEVISVDIPVQALVTVLVLLFLYASPRGIKKPEALVLLAIYLGYIGFRLTYAWRIAIFHYNSSS
jgi:cation:H+ antiporter